MGRVFEIGFRGATAAAGAAYGQIIAGASGALRIREIGFFSATAVAASVGLGRAANQPATAAPIAALQTDPRDAVTSLASAAASWSTAPTVPAAFYRRIVLPAVIGAGIIWSWPAEAPLIVIPVAAVGQALVLWNFGAAAGPAPDIYVRGEE
jgi:hypothetical protein